MHVNYEASRTYVTSFYITIHGLSERRGFRGQLSSATPSIIPPQPPKSPTSTTLSLIYLTLTRCPADRPRPRPTQKWRELQSSESGVAFLEVQHPSRISGRCYVRGVLGTELSPQADMKLLPGIIRAMIAKARYVLPG